MNGISRNGNVQQLFLVHRHLFEYVVQLPTVAVRQPGVLDAFTDRVHEHLVMGIELIPQVLGLQNQHHFALWIPQRVIRPDSSRGVILRRDACGIGYVPAQRGQQRFDQLRARTCLVRAEHFFVGFHSLPKRLNTTHQLVEHRLLLSYGRGACLTGYGQLWRYRISRTDQPCLADYRTPRRGRIGGDRDRNRGFIQVTPGQVTPRPATPPHLESRQVESPHALSQF